MDSAQGWPDSGLQPASQLAQERIHWLLDLKVLPFRELLPLGHFLGILSPHPQPPLSSALNCCESEIKPLGIRSSWHLTGKYGVWMSWWLDRRLGDPLGTHFSEEEVRSGEVTDQCPSDEYPPCARHCFQHRTGTCMLKCK